MIIDKEGRTPEADVSSAGAAAIDPQLRESGPAPASVEVDKGSPIPAKAIEMKVSGRAGHASSEWIAGNATIYRDVRAG